jgi:hypothetical protein
MEPSTGGYFCLTAWTIGNLPRCTASLPDLGGMECIASKTANDLLQEFPDFARDGLQFWVLDSHHRRDRIDG